MKHKKQQGRETPSPDIRSDDWVALQRAIRGQLRSTLHAHGVITTQNMESATKRISRQLVSDFRVNRKSPRRNRRKATKNEDDLVLN